MDLKQVGVFFTIPFVLAIPPILGWYIGGWLDTQLGTAHFMAYFWIVLGLVAGGREVYRIISRFGDGV